jgi:hypothetical protein
MAIPPSCRGAINKGSNPKVAFQAELVVTGPLGFQRLLKRFTPSVPNNVRFDPAPVTKIFAGYHPRKSDPVVKNDPESASVLRVTIEPESVVDAVKKLLPTATTGAPKSTAMEVTWERVARLHALT